MTGSEPASVTVDRILEKVSQKYGVSVEDIKGRKRTKEIALVRHRSIYIIRKLTDLSLPAIGKLFGRDHTTIMASLDTVEREMAKDSLLELEMNDLIRELRRQGNNLNQLVVMARQGHVELVNMEPFMEVYENTWQTLNSLLSRVG